VISKADPEYSEEARRAKISGSVLLKMTIGADGFARISSAARIGYGLDEKAIEAVQKWRFKSAMRDGAPIATRRPSR